MIKYNIVINNAFNKTLWTNIIFNNFKYLLNYSGTIHNKNSINTLLSSPTLFTVFVNEETTNKTIGYLIGENMELHDGRYIFYLSYIYIVSPYRSFGIGNKLMNIMINNMKNNNIKFILLSCLKQNEKLYKYYNKYGFDYDANLPSTNTILVLSLKV